MLCGGVMSGVVWCVVTVCELLLYVGMLCGVVLCSVTWCGVTLLCFA